MKTRSAEIPNVKVVDVNDELSQHNLKKPEQVKADNDRVAVQLRSIEPRDLQTLFEFQLDPEANRLAATNPRNSDEFTAHWKKLKKTRVSP